MENLKDPNFSIGFNPFKPDRNDDQRERMSAQMRQNIKIGIIIIILLAMMAMVYLIFRSLQAYVSNKAVPPIEPPPAAVATTTTGSLLPKTGDAPANGGNASSSAQAEHISFGSRYALDFQPVENKAARVELPLSVKADVANYYDVTRRINLDKQIDSLNNDGFAMIDNPFGASANDFFSAYGQLVESGVPQYITSDFLMYYYQNKIKEVYSDIRSNVFYKDLWSINHAFFDFANTRYRKTKLKMGEVNDPVLEGQRLEAAFFAVALELLKPREEQVNKGNSLNSVKFSQKEVKDFDFVLPDYLAADVNREVALVLHANRTEKSPVLLYERNYKDFAKDQDDDDEKINNFNLSTRWFSAAFPLYERSAECESCLLDKNDWLINFVTANYIAKDFSDNQALKNRWARIYKIASYFSGLRSDLTYLHYAEVLKEEFGDNYELDAIFTPELAVDDKIALARQVRDKIASKYSFAAIEGGVDRSDPTNTPYLGMRMLQDNFWPDTYIFNNLTGERSGAYNGPLKFSTAGTPKGNSTGCLIRNRLVLRCYPTAYDVVNLIKPIEDSGFFTENTAYADYHSNAATMRDQLSYFTVDSWHANAYWTTLSIMDKSVFGFESLEAPVYQLTPNWQRRQNNTFLGSWVNLRLPADTLTVNWQKKNTSLGESKRFNVYVEPNLRLVDDIIANAKMLNDVLLDLQIISDVDYSSKRLIEFRDEMLNVRNAIKKELSGEELLDADEAQLAEIIQREAKFVKDSKRFTVKEGVKKNLVQSVDGIKLLAQVYAKKDKKILVVGPIFNYREFVKH